MITVNFTSKAGIHFMMVVLLLVLITGVTASSSHARTGQTEDRSAQGLHIHLISGSDEYKSEPFFRNLKREFAEQYPDIKITATWGQDRGDALPGIEMLEQADLMVVFARRITVPENQLNYIIRHIEAEKPVLGIRTASHAFQNFLELDSLVFGGDYDGHGDDEPVTLQFAEGSERHPILTNVRPWQRMGKLYHNAEPGPNTQVLIYGTGDDSGIHEPLAWTNIYGENGRAFYTSMGLPADFENEQFRQLIRNAITWTTGYRF